MAVENSSPSVPEAVTANATPEKDEGVTTEMSAPSPEQTLPTTSDTPVSDGPVIVPGSSGFTFHADPHASATLSAAPATDTPSTPPQDEGLADILEEPAGPVMIPGVQQSAAPHTPQDTLPPVEADVLESDVSALRPEAEAAPSPVQEHAVEAAPAIPAEVVVAPSTEPPSQVAGLRRCEHCGFPVSEGRQLCLDCERKAAAAPATEPKAATNPTPERPFQSLVNRQNVTSPPVTANTPAPAFLPERSETSWLASHKLLVISAAILIAATVAFLLFR
jgi:hypothetical protein